VNAERERRAAALVKRTCAVSRVPETVEDASVLELLAELFAAPAKPASRGSN
jgi:hypothetical protein